MAPKTTKLTKERTFLLVGQPYDDRIDVGTDVAIIYGHTGNYSHRAQRWRQAGYIAHFMTGANCGSYDDYITGNFDDKEHFNERQQKADGSRAERSPSVYYLVPTMSYIEYLKSVIAIAIDAGTKAIYLAEPEYSAEASYSTAFKSEWRNYFGKSWKDPWSSVQARYQSGQLKSFLLFRALQAVLEFAKSYAKSKNTRIKCYIATHSLINYAHWGIISPESNLLNIPHCDGLIAHVSTVTARTPNSYNGVRRERTFETALMEYGIFAKMVRVTKKSLIFYLDPVEDYPDHPWEDYKRNFEDTLIAALMCPEVYKYLTIPWPKRIFLGQHSLESSRADEKVPIPPGYMTQLLIINNTLKNMNQDSQVWQRGFVGIGILLSDTMLFQRGGPSSTDQDLSFFYGLAVPFIKFGIIPQPMIMEQIISPRFLDDTRILIMSYSYMKPLKPDFHAILSEWVKSGRILIYIDDLKDPFNKIKDWWNSGMYQYTSPAQHLFETLGLGPNPDFDDIYFVGRGRVILKQANPSEFAHSRIAANELRSLVGDSVQFLWRGRRHFRTQNFLTLRRGPYVIVKVLDESFTLKPLRLRGKFIDLLDPELTYYRKIELYPGERAFLFKLSKINRFEPYIIASASSISKQMIAPGHLKIKSSGPTGTQCITKIFLPKKPHSIDVLYDNQPIPTKLGYERFKRILTLRYENFADGVEISIKFPIPRYPFKIKQIKKLLSYLKFWNLFKG